MGFFTWDGESEDVTRDSATADRSATSAMGQYGLDAGAAPTPKSLVRNIPAPLESDKPAGERPPLTRRELRERERAAELREIVAATAATPVGAAWPVVASLPSSDLSAPPASAGATTETVFADSVEQIFAPEAHTTLSESSRMSSAKLSRKPGPRSFRRTRKPAVVQTSAARSTAHHTGRRSPLKRRILTKLMSFGAMTGAALMLVATSLPANAFLPAEAAPMNAESSATSEIASEAEAPPVVAEAQSLKTEPTVTAPVLKRDGYTAVSLRQQIFLRYGNRNFAYTPDQSGAIRWPFPIAVPISDGFGPRVSPCGGCSSDHQGLDMTAGNGAAISAIADGVVVGVNSEGWSYGQHVIVEHVINGQRIQSWYAHMATGSIRVNVGDVLKVGDQIGQVGSTGASTGPHLHLGIYVKGVAIDPFAWLLANTG